MPIRLLHPFCGCNLKFKLCPSGTVVCRTAGGYSAWGETIFSLLVRKDCMTPGFSFIILGSSDRTRCAPWTSWHHKPLPIMLSNCYRSSEGKVNYLNDLDALLAL